MAAKKQSHRNLRKSLIILTIVIGFLVVARLLLPYIVLRYCNKTLAQMKGYYGHIQDIDIALTRGAYRIDSIYLNKVDSVTQNQTPFFSSTHIDLSVEWKALFHGSFVGEIIFEQPRLIFVKEKVEPSALQEDSTDFRELLKDFMPLKVNRFEISGGTIQYKDEGSKPKVDIQMDHVFVLAQNLKNSYDSTELLPAKITASATVYEGTLSFDMDLNPLADLPTFDLNAELKNTNLVKLNEFFQAYAKIDVNKGTFGMYTEVAARDGKFTGYVKPLIQDLDVLGKEDRHDNILRKMWEAIAGTMGEIFKNQPEDQVATKIPFEGEIKKPSANIGYAIVGVLRNAFIQAIQPSIDYEINITSVKEDKKDNKPEKKRTLLQKVFGSNKDKNK